MANEYNGPIGAPQERGILSYLADAPSIPGAIYGAGKSLIKGGANQILRSQAESEGIDPSTVEAPNDGRTYADGTPSAPAPQPPEEFKGVLIPDSVEDPGGAVRGMAFNRAAGVGNGVGLTPPPQAPTPKEMTRQVSEQEGKQVLFDQNKIPKPMESNAFNMGLMSFGLNLLSGNDWATSFNQAGTHFDQAYGREKREAWRQDLVNQGFDAQEIERYIETGDNKVLSDPMEKKMKMQAYQMGQEQLQTAMRANDPAAIQYQQDRQNWQDQMTMKQMENQTLFQNENLKIAQAQLGLSQQKLEIEAKAAAAKAAQAPKYNEALSKAENHYLRARQGLSNYQETEKRFNIDYSSQGFGKKFADAATIDMIFSGNAKAEMMARSVNHEAAEIVNAEREWLAPVLRKDSGAAISQGEWKTTGEVYFPRPGDSPDRIAQKQQSREVATLAMDPQAPESIKQANRLYSQGQLKALRLVNGQVYANDGKGWFVVQQ
ncbi:MAG: hypothetical protein ACRCZ2_01775 [Fusobacteriaceae bacterium]